MNRISFSKQQLSLIEKAVRYMISNLQYERHQALAHGCSSSGYDKEIQEYRQLKEFLNNESV